MALKIQQWGALLLTASTVSPNKRKCFAKYSTNISSKIVAGVLLRVCFWKALTSVFLCLLPLMPQLKMKLLVKRYVDMMSFPLAPEYFRLWWLAQLGDLVVLKHDTHKQERWNNESLFLSVTSFLSEKTELKHHVIVNVSGSVLSWWLREQEPIRVLWPLIGLSSLSKVPFIPKTAVCTGF